MFTLTNPRIELQCDCCPARTSFGGHSITACKFEARDAGWKFFTDRVNKDRGEAVCPDCNDKGRRPGC